jgi:hypothetical protein
METILGEHSKEARDRAQAIAKREQQRRARIAADNDAEGDAVRENTARLKSLRLTKEAAERTGEEDARSVDKAIPVEKLNASNDD